MSYPAIQNHETLKQSVDARELHSFLEIGKDFSSWIKAQIKRADLVKYADFEELTQKGELSRTGQTRTDYALSIESAKNISMMSQSEKGKEVRRYFIECEKKALAPQSALTDEEIVMQALTIQTKKVQALEHQVEELKPKAGALDRIATADGSLNITNTAKALQIQPQKTLFPWLKLKKWIYRRAGGSSWLGYQDKVQQGLLEHKVTMMLQPDGTEKVREQVLITPKGLAKLANIFESDACPQ